MVLIWSSKRPLCVGGIIPAETTRNTALHSNRINETTKTLANTNSIRCDHRNHRHRIDDDAAPIRQQLDNYYYDDYYKECSGTNNFNSLNTDYSYYYNHNDYDKFECDSVNTMTKIEKNNLINSTTTATAANQTNDHNHNTIETTAHDNSYHTINQSSSDNVAVEPPTNGINVNCVTAATTAAQRITAHIMRFVKCLKQKRTFAESWLAVACYLLIISSIPLGDAHKMDGGTCTRTIIYSSLFIKSHSIKHRIIHSFRCPLFINYHPFFESNPYSNGLNPNYIQFDSNVLSCRSR